MTDARWSRRDLFKRAGLTVVAAAGLPVIAAGCARVEEPSDGTGGGILDRIKQEGKIKVGFANEAPYGFRDQSGELTGEAPEVARVVFKNIGNIELEPVLVDSFDNLIPGLQEKQYDIIAAGMFINPERCEQIAFSNPDYAAPNAFLVKEGNPKGLSTFDDAANKDIKLGVLSGAVEGGYAEDSGVKSGNIQKFQKADLAFRGLLDGRVDAVALTSITLEWTKKDKFADDPVEVTQPFIPTIKGEEQVGAGGFGFRKDDNDLLDAFNAELKKLQDGGQLLKIVEPFGFDQVAVDKAKELTAEELCTTKEDE